MKLSQLLEQLKQKSLSTSFGIVTRVESTVIKAQGMVPSIGDSVNIACVCGKNVMGMVTAVDAKNFSITPFGFVEGLKIGDMVTSNSDGLNVPVGEGLLGRVVDPFMRPIDGLGDIEGTVDYPIIKPPIEAMKRGLIDESFSVGVKTIDGLLTCGKGQKLGIFAGSGVGKSTLMGMLVKGSNAPIKVVALIGERGREVPEFIEKSLNGDLTNTVLIVATSDDSPLMRKYGAFAAMSVAEFFKDQGQDVLFLMDSITRFAMAQREIGLALGEPPTSKGYPPSVLTLLPQLMERAGKEEGKGSITAFFTVLVEGDDMSDPIADQSRSILDGHFVLSRSLTDMGIYPPIDILNSASRVMGDVISDEQSKAVREFRKLYALLKDNETLIRIGAYKTGSDPLLDLAISKRKFMNDFMSQTPNDIADFKESIDTLISNM